MLTQSPRSRRSSRQPKSPLSRCAMFPSGSGPYISDSMQSTTQQALNDLNDSRSVCSIDLVTEGIVGDPARLAMYGLQRVRGELDSPLPVMLAGRRTAAGAPHLLVGVRWGSPLRRTHALNAFHVPGSTERTGQQPMNSCPHRSAARQIVRRCLPRFRIHPRSTGCLDPPLNRLGMLLLNSASDPSVVLRMSQASSNSGGNSIRR